MYILTKNKVITDIAIKCELKLIGEIKQEQYELTYENGNKCMVPKMLIDNVFEVAELPEKVEPQKYCYTEKKGFYKNEEYREYYSNEQRIQALEEMMNELILGE